MYLNHRMQTALVLTNATNPVSLDDESYKQYEGLIQQLVEKNPWNCLIYEPTDKLEGIPLWYQRWVLPYIDVPGEYKLRFEHHPWTKELGLYADLRTKDVNGEYMSNFDEEYHYLVELVQSQLKTMYNEGYIICSKKQAEELKLSLIKLVRGESWLCVPNWDILEISKLYSPVVVLLRAIEQGWNFSKLISG